MVFPPEPLRFPLLQGRDVSMQTSCLEAAIAAKPAAWAEPPGSSEGGKFLSQYLDKLAGIMHNAVAGLFSSE